MPYWYWRKLKNDWAVDEDTTNRFDLPTKGHVSGLWVKLRQTNEQGNYATDNGWPFQQTDIRIVGNGNVEIIDLDGEFLEAIDWWNTGVMPKNNLWDDVSNIQEAHLFIPFGRYMGDTEMGLILDRFSAGVQFEETNEIDTDEFSDGYSQYDIWALMRKDPEGGLFRNGYLRKRNIKTKDADSDSEFEVTLPTTNKLRQIYLFDVPSLSSNVPATVPFTLIQKLWLGLKSGDEYMIDNLDSTIFARIIHQYYKRMAHTGGITKVASAEDNFFDTMIYERAQSQLTPMDSTGVMAFEAATTFYERVCQLYAEDDGGSRVSKYVYVDSWGILYHGLIPLLYQDPMSEPTDWLDTYEQADVTVKVTEGSGSGNWYLVLDELQEAYPS